MHLLSFLLLLFGFQASVPRVSNGCPASGQPGVDSRYGIVLCFQDFDAGKRRLDIPSPDGSARYIINGDKGQFYVRGRAVGEQFLVGNDEELIWSPDSRAVITTLIFGAAGPTTAGVDYVDQKVPADLDNPALTPLIQRNFVTRHAQRARLACGEADDINVGGLGWTNDSRRALLVGEIGPTQRCGDDWGYFDVYVVSFPQGKVLQAYPMAEALKRFKRFLGPGLRRDVPKLRQKPVGPWDTN